jgi:hypothetical protein
VRRGLGRGRTLIGIGAIIAIIGVFLDWSTVGGEVLPPVTTTGFEGAGVLVFLASVAMLAVIVLPYASRTGHSSLDRYVTYLALLVIAAASLLVEVLGFWNAEQLGFPDRAPGLWLSGLGLILVLWGVAELFAERDTTQ